MLLRERQKEFVDNAIRCLDKYQRTLGIASTGAGKTVCLSFVIKHYLECKTNFKACVLAHRDELTIQNEEKFKLVSPNTATSIFNASSKDWSGDVVFAMVQTLSKESNLNTIPKLDLLVIDEAHHATSDSYQNIINSIIALNPQVLIFGVTATPVRSDKALLRKVFSSICDTIRLGELIASGHLVEPKTQVIDVGITDEILKLRTRNDEFNMDKIECLINTSVINDKVVQVWLEKAQDRKTVIFCSTITHAMDVTESFIKYGINTSLITGQNTSKDRADTFRRLDQGKIQVIVNVSVLTEGWDYQPISCVVLLRPCSFKGTMIQMIGRGLRTVDYALYPNTQKNDCLVLDFGASVITHGSLEQDINFAREGFVGNGASKEKHCPSCDAIVPQRVYECDLCGYEFEKKEKEEKIALQEFKMKEIDLFSKSNFKWIKINNDTIQIVAGFYVSSIISLKDGVYIAVGINEKNKQIKIIYKGSNLQAIAAANDFLNQHETDDSCYNSKKWQKLIATNKQREYLPIEYKNDHNINRYTAACLLKLKFNINNLRSLNAI